MGDEKSMIVMASRDRERDRELLIPVAGSASGDVASMPSSSSSFSHHHSGHETLTKVVRSWASKKFMTGWCGFIFSVSFAVSNFLALASFYKIWYHWNARCVYNGCPGICALFNVIWNFHLWPSFKHGSNSTKEDSTDINQESLLVVVILFPIAITFYITWWFIHFVDGFFSPIYAQLGIDVFGLGFVTSITFIFVVGVFMSSWLGASVLSLGEWFIKRMPFVRHIYNASKQISSAISPDQNTQAFKEVAIIRHPRIGEYAFGFITSTVVLQNYSGEEELCCVYVPTNHLYIGDIFLINIRDVIRPNLSVREGIEIVVSGGMSMPQILSTLDSRISVDRSRSERS